MSYLSESARPTRRTLCHVLRKSTNWKCLILTILIATCLGAIIWCRITRVTKILLDFNAFPITRRQVSPCEDGYVYIPIAFVIMLYLLYLVECWHSNARIFLSLEKVDINSVYRKIYDLKESQPVIWWKAICYHYVRRVRQTTRYRNGETLTSSQTYYERVNSNAIGSSFFYNICGMKDYSKEVADLEKFPATKIKFSKGFVFANIATATEFEEQRSCFFREQERLDDYMEMREGLEFPNIHFNETLVAWTSPECPPWFGRINVFWLCSFLLLSWPIRILLELNTAHLHYKVIKLFGVNYPSDTNLVQLQRPLLTSNYLHHIQQNSRRQHNCRNSIGRPEYNHHHHHNHNRNRLSRLRSIENSLEDSSNSSSAAAEPLLPPENAFANSHYYNNNNNHQNLLVIENSFNQGHSSSSFNNIDAVGVGGRKDEMPSLMKAFGGNEFDLQYQAFKHSNNNRNVNGNVGTSRGWAPFASSLLRRTFSRNSNLRSFIPRSITLMIEPSSSSSASASACNNNCKGLFNQNKRNYSFYSNASADGEENEFLVPSYSEALLLLEPKPTSTDETSDQFSCQTNTNNDSILNMDDSITTSITVDNNNSQSHGRQRNLQEDLDYYEDGTSSNITPTSANVNNNNNRCISNDNGSTYHQSHSSCHHNHDHQHHNNGDRMEGSSLMTSTPNASSFNLLPAAVEIDLTHPVVSSFPLDPRRQEEGETSRNQSSSLEISQEQEEPPSYIEALRTSRPVFISTFTRLRRCFTERDLAGGINGTSSSHNRHDILRERILQTWITYYSRYPTFLQRMRLPNSVTTLANNNNNEERRNNRNSCGTNNEITKL